MEDKNEQFMVYGYVRVSTRDQKYETQEESIVKYCGLRGWKIAKIFADKRSGKDIERDGFQKMMQDLDMNPYGVKAIVIYKLDRIGRNLRDLIDIFEGLKKKNISVVSISDSIDTTTPTGKLAFHILGALAEYERDLILERTRVGREYAIEHKTAVFGRKKVHINMNLVRELLSRGVPKERIAKDLRISRGTLYSRIAADKEGSISEPEK